MLLVLFKDEFEETKRNGAGDFQRAGSLFSFEMETAAG